MDAGVIAAIIGAVSAVGVAVVTALFGIVTYRQQKRVDRESYVDQKVTDRKVELRNRRMKEYERYLTAYRGFSSLYDFDPPPAENDEERIKAINEYWLAYSSLFQLASDSVLLAVTAFHKLAWMGDTDLTGEAYDQEFKHLYAAMIIEMRKDAFEQTELHMKLVEERLPFNFSQASKPVGGVK
jgi:hypothetical protein